MKKFNFSSFQYCNQFKKFKKSQPPQSYENLSWLSSECSKVTKTLIEIFVDSQHTWMAANVFPQNAFRLVIINYRSISQIKYRSINQNTTKINKLCFLNVQEISPLVDRKSYAEKYLKYYLNILCLLDCNSFWKASLYVIYPCQRSFFLLDLAPFFSYTATGPLNFLLLNLPITITKKSIYNFTGPAQPHPQTLKQVQETLEPSIQ